MADKIETDWYLKEWMDHLGRIQADLVKDLGWLKGRASKVVNSQQAYRRETVTELAEWLGIRPFELLMPPSEALALRRLRETAALIAAEHGADYEAPPPANADRRDNGKPPAKRGSGR